MTGKVDGVVGMDNGDEGKGKAVDGILENGEYGVLVRFNGANNAGHTLETPGGNLVLNSIPSGVFNRNITNYIGSGCLVDPVHLVAVELPRVKPFQDLTGRFKISAFATTTTPVHILWDRLTGGGIGTTGRGIGPAYMSQVQRSEGDRLTNIRIAEVLAFPQSVMESIRVDYQNKLKILSLFPNQYDAILRQIARKNGIDPEGVNYQDLLSILDAKVFKMEEKIEEFMAAAMELKEKGFIENNLNWVTQQIQQGVNVLMEGAQAYGLDVRYGAAPYTTSSSTIADAAFVGGDVSSRYRGKFYGVTKAVPSRVGSGPFVGELGGRASEAYCDEKDEKGDSLHSKAREKQDYPDREKILRSTNPFEMGVGIRMKTGEYGATTGRPRRVGVMDLMRLKSAVQRSGLDGLFVTKVDCIGECFPFDNQLFNGKAPLVTGYSLGGVPIDYVPATAGELYEVAAQYTLVDTIGDISRARTWEELPPEAQQFVEFIQAFTACKVMGVGVGPSRDAMIYRG